MRFGRAKKNWGFLRHQTKDNGSMASSGRVAGEERSALLSESDAGPSQQSPGESRVARNDAIQDLQSTLGRFHRGIIRGREGAPSDRWTADCMDELIAAVELARAQRWPEVLKALVDTGRVLQSCEDAGLAEEALPFLEDSHDLLAMIAVDLSVGTLRPGVMDRWREHYHDALQDLEEQGIDVIADDDGQPERAAVSASVPRQATADENGMPFTPVSVTPPALDPGDALPVLDELPPLGVLGVQDAPVVSMPDPGASYDDEDDEEDDEDDDDFPLLEAFGEASYMHVDEDASEAPASLTVHEAGGLPREVENLLDVLCAELNTLEGKAAGARDPEALFDYLAQLREYARAMKSQPAESLCQGFVVLCQMLSEDVDAWGNDRFFEIAYSFCGAYGEACTLGETATVAAWRDEAESFVESLSSPAVQDDTALGDEEIAEQVEVVAPATAPDGDGLSLEDYIAAQAAGIAPEALELEEQDAVDAVPDPAPYDAVSPALDLMPEEPSGAAPGADEDFPEYYASGVAGSDSTSPEEPDSVPSPEAAAVEQLLETARQALLKGDAGDAKLLALRAAAQIAAVETAKAEALVHQTERRLRENTQAIDAARSDVQHVEQEVASAEHSVVNGREAVQARHGDIAASQAGLEAIDARIAQIEDEMRRLDEQRRAELDRRVAQERECEAIRQAAVDAEAQLEALRAAEEAARVRLEEARQNVKHHQLRRSELEAAVTQARDALVTQRNSLVDLDKTITLVKGEVPSETEPGDELF